MNTAVDLLPFGMAMNLVFGGLLVYRYRHRRDALSAIRAIFLQGKVAGQGRVRINADHYRKLSVPMIVELAELEGFALIGDEGSRDTYFLIFQRQGNWGGRRPLRRRREPS